MKQTKALIVAFILVPGFLLISCATTQLENKLDPVSEEFFDKVRYIISKEEAKIFLELPPAARPDFIEDFWKRRDPDPGTEENEYREAYYQRIDDANRLFKGGGRPGWLQERGRIYILFGPPDERVINPMGGRPIDPYVEPHRMTDSTRVRIQEKPSETWIYRDLFSSLQKPQIVRLIFVDSYGTGDYKLTTNVNELTPGLMGIETQFAPNLALTHELHKEESTRAQQHRQRTLFDFSWEFLKLKNKELGSNLSINILLPYEKVIFVEQRGRIRADLRLVIQVRDNKEKVAWQFNQDYPLDFKESFLEESKGTDWMIEIPITKWLDKGAYMVYIRLENPSGGQKVEKLLSLKM